jgi:hypothetical protein
MDMDPGEILVGDLLETLTEKYRKITDNQIIDTEALQDALTLIPHCKVYYCKSSISRYYDLLLRLTKHSRSSSRIVATIEENIRSGDSDQYLPNIDLLLILQIKFGIYEMLDPSTISYFNNIVQSSPLEETIRAKRNRDGDVIERDRYSNFVEYLACLSFKIFGTRSSDEVVSLFIEVRDILTEMLDLGANSKTDYPVLFLKILVNMIRCMSLFLEKTNLEYREYFQPGLFQRVIKTIKPHFTNEEISEAWLEILCQTDSKNPKITLLSYLPNTLIDTLHGGSNLIKNTFLRFMKSARIQIFMHYLSRFDKSLFKIKDFEEKVFMIGIMKSHGQDDHSIKDLITNNRCLLKLNYSRILLDYCYEMLILLHRRGLLKMMKEVIIDLITNFNRRLYSELENMNLASLCRAGDYISLLPDEPESKELAKKWIESIIRPEILRLQREDIFCLYIRILVLAYTPEDHYHLETSITQLNNLSQRIETYIRDNTVLGQRYWIPYADRISEIAYNSISRLIRV